MCVYKGLCPFRALFCHLLECWALDYREWHGRWCWLSLSLFSQLCPSLACSLRELTKQIIAAASMLLRQLPMRERECFGRQIRFSLGISSELYNTVCKTMVRALAGERNKEILAAGGGWEQKQLCCNWNKQTKHISRHWLWGYNRRSVCFVHVCRWRLQKLKMTNRCKETKFDIGYLLYLITVSERHNTEIKEESLYCDQKWASFVAILAAGYIWGT